MRAMGQGQKAIYRERKKKEADLRSFSRRDSGLRECEIMSLTTEKWVIGRTQDSRTAKRLGHCGRKEATWNKDDKNGAMNVREPNQEQGERERVDGGRKNKGAVL